MNPFQRISSAWGRHPAVARMSALRRKYFGEDPAAPARLDGWTKAGVALLLLLVPAAALRSSHLSDIYDADSLLTSLISLQKITLFYWGTNRFGNLLPFLTAWIHDIDLNFQAQVYLRALGCACVPLLVFSFLGVRRHFLAAYAIALALSFLPFNDAGNSVWVWITPYGQSVPPLLCALWLHHRNHYRARSGDLARALGTLLMVFLAFYVNAGLVVFALPLWTGYAVLYPRARNWWFAGILLAGFVCYSVMAARYGREYHDAYDYSRFTFTVANMVQFCHTFGSVVSALVYGACLAVTVVGLAAVWRAGRRDAGGPVLAPLVVKSHLIFFAAAVYILLFANMDWVTIKNHSTFRYFWFPLVLAAPLCAAALAEGAHAVAGMEGGAGERPRWALASISIYLLSSALLWRLAPFGGSLPPAARLQKANALALADLARKYGATYVAGDYYAVWPAVFESIRVAQAAGDPAALEIRGLGQRGEHLRPKIAESLRRLARVVVLGAGLAPANCYGHALYNDAVDWPPYASLVAEGQLPSGGSYCVIAFDRQPPPGAARLPRAQAVMMLMLSLDPQTAHWEQGRIAVQAGGGDRKVWGGPFVNVPAGNYTVAFQIETHGDASMPLCELVVQDGFGSREYVRKKFRIGDLQQRDGGAWASIDFTVPPSSPTRVMEFVMNTSGGTSFTASALDLRRQD